MGRTQDALQAAEARRREGLQAIGASAGPGYHAVGGQATTSRLRHASLRIVGGHLQGTKHAFDSADVVMIGRAVHNDIRFDPFEDPTVSSCHAEVRYEGGRFYLYDLGSLNGTYLNGRSVRRCGLKPGDEIGLGRHGPTLTFAMEERASKAAKKADRVRRFDLAEEKKSDSATAKELVIEDDEVRMRRIERLLQILVGAVACDFVVRIISNLR